MRFALYTFLLALLCNACIPPSDRDDSVVKIDLSDPMHRKIIELKDRREVDSLMYYLNSDDVTYRYLSAEAFGSVRDPKAIQPLSTLLVSDPSAKVRLQAAYALGQIGDPSAAPLLTKAFGSQDTADYNTPLRMTILEAVGKTGDQTSLELISSVSTYSSESDQLLLGQLRAFYRFAQRGIKNTSSIDQARAILANKAMSQEVRQIAADFLSRFMVVEKTESVGDLSKLILTEKDPLVRASIANALVKSGNPDILPQLLSMLNHDPDYRIKTNILRSIDAYEYYDIRDTLLRLLEDPQFVIANLSAKAMQRIGHRRDAGLLLNLARKTDDPILKSNILAAAIHPVPSTYVNTRSLINQELVNGLKQAHTPYQRASYIEALSLDPVNYPIFREEGLFSNEIPVQTRAISAIKDVMTNPRTLSIYRYARQMNIFRSKILEDLMKVFNQNDPGAMAAIANVLQNPELKFKEQIDIIVPFREALRKLKLPEATETQYELLSLLEYLEDTTYQRKLPQFNHPIQWEHLNRISDSSHAYIITPKGQINIQLMTTHAPATVANFVGLANSKYFNGKSIHRVVPNFVIQGGCSRGDGYGGLDYTIRSELGSQYFNDEGYIGMASAGPDTEGTQWFITHSATPHLDGRYTIFGKVVEGMDVVHEIRVGDIVQDVRILKF